MDDLRVTPVEGTRVIGVGDREGGRRERPPRRQPSDGKPKRSPDELAFLLRRSHVAGTSLVDTRVELLNEGGELRVRIVDADTGNVVGEMSGEELARLAREAHVTTGVLGEWRQ